MKKILVFIALIICVSMLLTSCDAVLDLLSSLNGGSEETTVEASSDEASSDEESSEEATTEPEEERVDDVDANIAMLIKLFNTFENAGQILDKVQNVAKPDAALDFTKMLDEFKKIEVQGNTKVDAWENGEFEEAFDLFFAIKDNNFHLAGVVDGVDGGIRASISDSLMVTLAAWEKENGVIEIDDAMAFNIDDIKDQYMGMMGDSMSQITDMDLPFDLADIKLGGLKTSDIEYKDGKYILKKNALYNCVIDTIDSFVDAAADEGLITDDMEDQYKEIKKSVKKVFNAIDLEIYFFVEYEVIEGFGMNANAKLVDIAKAMGVEDPDPNSIAGGLEYIKAAFEISEKGEFVNFEFKQNGYVNKVDAKMEFVTEGEKLMGVDMTYNMDIHTSSESIQAAERDFYTGEIIREEIHHKNETIVKADYVANISVLYNGDEACGLTFTGNMDAKSNSNSYENGVIVYDSADNIKLEASARLDFSKLGKDNANVLDVNFKMVSEYGYTNRGGEKRETKDEVKFTTSLKTTTANKVDLIIDYSENYVSKENGVVVNSDKDTYKIAGSFEVTTKNVTLPVLDKVITDAIEEAKKNPMDPFAPSEEPSETKPEWDVSDTVAPEWNYTETMPEYDNDFNEDIVVTIKPEYDYSYNDEYVTIYHDVTVNYGDNYVVIDPDYTFDVEFGYGDITVEIVSPDDNYADSDYVYDEVVTEVVLPEYDFGF